MKGVTIQLKQKVIQPLASFKAFLVNYLLQNVAFLFPYQRTKAGAVLAIKYLGFFPFMGHMTTVTSTSRAA